MHWLAYSCALALTGTSPLAAQTGEVLPTTMETPALPPAIAQSQAGPSANVPIQETLTMQMERNRRMTVPVTIMGKGPFHFMVDTGAQATVLSSELAERLGLFDRANATLVGMASTRAVQTTMVPDFMFGSRIITIRTAPILERSHIGDADGILGLDSLQNQRVLLDFENGELTVSSHFSSDGAGGYDIIVRARERLGQLIIHRAQIDGVSTAVIVDTGAQSSFGNLALRNRMRRRALEREAVMTDVNGVTVTGPTHVASRLSMDRVELSNIPISFADSPTFHWLGLADRPAMVLGMNELSVFRRVAIDFRSRRILFDLPGDVPLDNPWYFNRRATRLPQD
ncbi:MAG: retroviral-like aspartic protease family protein [Alteraurantiacibacter sp. bin_em_oilr2.035]|nr:retroviral-like aspartic protease family protein [Alteraurantiacibacter sp. bin_em_oilr2.035]